MRLWMGLSVVLLAAAGCGRPPAIEITTRENGTFVLADPIVNYGRVCDSQQSDVVERGGLRRRGDVISWSSLESIEFAAKRPEGDPTCDRLLDAEVRYRDGRPERTKLYDTLWSDTAHGSLLGETVRGRLAIPLREIARLRSVPNEDWAWVYREVSVEAPVRVTTDKGEVHEFRQPVVRLPRSERMGHMVRVRSDMSVYGLPVKIAGAEITIGWADLRLVELARDSVRLTYTDGRTEAVRLDKTTGDFRQSVRLVDGARSSFDVDAHALSLDSVTRIEVIAGKP